MKDEVEDFLRRVAQMRAQAEAQAKGQPPPPPVPSKQQKPQAQRPQRTPPPPPQRLVPDRQLPPPFAPAAEPEVIDAELAQRDAVQRYVQADIRGPQEIAEHARRLGAEVDQADDKLEAHLHEVFDHQLGRLKKSASATAATPHEQPIPDMTLDEIQRLLRSPTSIRDAIIMAEILRRPQW